ncbi:HRD1 [Candida jiufengensis]|uniref:HRD1 n=1 Tax=Candida jiufengensis TaxID=497108 RepID=UPI0022242C60|nr:HRD1 [Candida jiufengensis]KAI5954592.1 HRD1 [Candida jiufengensis]
MFIIEFTDGIKLGIFINFIIFTFLLFNKVLQLILFGSLRIIEVEHLFEKLPIFAINLSLNMATAESNMILNVGLMGLAMTFKMIHIVMFDRLDFLNLKLFNKVNEEIEDEMNPSGTEFNLRYIIFYYLSSINFWLNLALIVLDFGFAKFLVYDVFQGVNSVTCLLFGFQYAVQGVEALTNLAKLALGFYEIVFYKIKARASRDREADESQLILEQSDVEEEEDLANSTIEADTSIEISEESIVEPSGNLGETDAEDIDNEEDDDDDMDFVWENKPYYSKAIEISSALLTATSYLFVIYLLTYHSGLSLPLSMLQGTYSSLRKAWVQINQLLAFIESSKRLDTQLPNATQSDLAENDNLCIICREDMYSIEDYQRIFKKPQSSRRCAKKLQCNHILHMGCLKDWLERSDNCPLCRRKVFGGTNINTRPATTPGWQEQQNQNQNHHIPNNAPPPPPAQDIPQNGSQPLSPQPQSPQFPHTGNSSATTTGASTPRNLYHQFNLSQSNFRRVSNDAMNVLNNMDREGDDVRERLRSRHQHQHQHQHQNASRSIDDEEYERHQRIIQRHSEGFGINDTPIESSSTSNNLEPTRTLPIPRYMQQSNNMSTTTTIPTTTRPSFQTIHLPTTAILPPDWVLLPLERVNNDGNENEEINYKVNLTTSTQANLRIRHNNHNK